LALHFSYCLLTRKEKEKRLIKPSDDGIFVSLLFSFQEDNEKEKCHFLSLDLARSRENGRAN